MAKEEWRSVPGFVGLYEVSDNGVVRSLDRLVRAGSGTRMARGQELRPTVQTWGHLKVNLCKNGSVYGNTIHAIVMLVFEGPCPEGLEIRHLDGVSSNNLLSNLKYGTKSENMKDRVRHGRDINAAKTHCPQGHPYAGDNLYISPQGYRQCRACGRESARRRREAG